ncbi:MAG: asparagine synthase (glutamine-hydrolyzing) [Bacteroidetes bacterium]|nr:asparagine synthase (glutamine-hydrolyzing) [Bacteroidota bacterium]
MCGIAGFIDPRISAQDAPALLERMLSSIAHRGPDARGTYFHESMALGQNRLSIIDLSADGNQPMHYFNASIVYNGEIYNYKELRATLIQKGYRFKTASDTEVILASYREYGRACVTKFIGMWSFALYDELSGELFCSRDRFGIKPFYYISDGDRFYFGSEYKALRPSPCFSNDINIDQISRGLQLGWVCYEDETYFNCLKSLPAASNLIYSKGKISIEKYWDLNPTTTLASNPEECIHEFRQLLESSVDLHLRSDVEIAICLSGGIDSSSLTGLIKQKYPTLPHKTFSIYYDGPGEVDERPFIQEVNDKYASLQPFYYKPEEGDILELFHDIMHQVDVPATGSSNFSHYYLLKKIKEKQVKVVVDGQGADEYLGGYMHSMYRMNADLMKHFRLKSLFGNLAGNVSRQNQSLGEFVSTLGKSGLSLFMNEMRLYTFEYKNYFPFVVQRDKQNIPFNLNSRFNEGLDNFLYQLIFTSSLPTILHYVDRMTMAHSVESRVPFLDHRLVEYAFTLNSNLKIRNGVTKYILRESVKDLLPDDIYNRRDKKGFVTPGEQKWLRGPLKHLLKMDYKKMDFLNVALVKQEVEKYEKGDNRNSKLIWRLAMLNYWMSNFQ